MYFSIFAFLSSFDINKRNTKFTYVIIFFNTFEFLNVINFELFFEPKYNKKHLSFIGLKLFKLLINSSYTVN